MSVNLKERDFAEDYAKLAKRWLSPDELEKD